MTKIFLLINSLDLNRGGLTKANLQQANIFNEMGYETYILTFNYNGDYKRVINKLRKIHNISMKVKIINMYDYFRNEKNIVSKEITLDDLINKNSITEKVLNQNAIKLYENGLYKKLVKYRKDKSIKKVDHFDNNLSHLKSEFYTLDGYIGKISYMDYNLESPAQMLFYKSDSNCYLRKNVNPKNGLATKVDLINDKKITRSFDNDKFLKTYFVEEIIKNNKKSIIISDARNTDEILININNSGNIKKYIRLHTNHLDESGNISANTKEAIENLNSIDGLLVLTNQQKNDIINEFGFSKKIKVIPHGIKINPILDNNMQKRENVAVVISRLVDIKQINHIIEAINLIKNHLTNFALEIYGIGKEYNYLKDLVIFYGLEKIVLFKGYTNNPIKIYKKSLFSLVTSKSEGFTLSILESMSCGTPVIAYNFNYGPNEIIDNNENGFIVKNNDIEELSKKILYLLKRKDLLEYMGNKAKDKISVTFSKEKVTEMWHILFNESNQ
ncbi:glycosyltransferase [Staphylococcus saprophyticus]|nr:glycosyltransferase [Staphylococcus saprophyticus]